MADKPSGIRFLCDEQLGKLSRWLRILGQDVVYRNDFPDDDLIECAREDGRIILTRDSRLPEKTGPLRIYLVKENYPYHQIREVIDEFREEISLAPFSRCADCNEPLEGIPKSEVEDRVPPFVFKTQNDFRTCPACGRVFWSATHLSYIKKQLGDILEDLTPEDKS